MNRRDLLKALAAAGAAATGSAQEKKSPTEPLDLQRKIEDTLAGRRPYEPLAYPYFSPDYKLPFLHIGTERQVFLDNFILEHLEDVERVLSAHAPATSHPGLALDRPYREAREAFERIYFENLLAQEHGSMSRVAERSGLERTHLYRKLKALGLPVGRREES